MQLQYFGDDALIKVSKPIKKVTKEIEELAAFMYVTMKLQNAVGLAAPQVGVNKRLIVVDCGKDIHPEPMYLINPLITKKENKCIMDEGCVSFPDFFIPKERYYYIEVKALNLSLQIVNIKAYGLLAQVIQHEIEHLDGKLLIDGLPEDIKQQEIINIQKSIQAIKERQNNI